MFSQHSALFWSSQSRIKENYWRFSEGRRAAWELRGGAQSFSLPQTRELPDNYHFLVIGTTNRVISIWPKVTLLKMGSLKSKSNKAMMPLIADNTNECAITYEARVASPRVHLTSVVCVLQDSGWRLIKRHNASNWFYIQLFSIYRWSQCIMSLPPKVRSNESYNYYCQIRTEFYCCRYWELVEMIKWAICRPSIIKP